MGFASDDAMTEFPPPRDPKQLLTEMDARIKVRDIRKWESLKRQVEVKWWESGLVALLFVSGAGMAVTIYKLVPADNWLLRAFIVTWCVLFLFTLLACIEFLIFKFRALRSMHERTAEMLEEQQAALRAIREYLEAREDAGGRE